MFDIIGMLFYFIIFSLFPIFLGIYTIIQDNNCQNKIKGVCVGVNKLCVKGLTTYSPVFQYEYNHIKYESVTYQTFYENNMVIGQTYSIFVNNKNPNSFSVTKKRNYGSYVLLFLGLFFAILPLFVST